MKLRHLIRVAGLIAAVVFLAPAIPFAAAAPYLAPHGFNLAYMDHSCKACDDFYEFAVGKYAAAHPIPADKSSVGSFDELADRNLATLHAILETAAAKTGTSRAPERQIGDYYAACMDTARIERDGLKPLRKPLGIVDGIKAKSELAGAVAQLALIGFTAYFNAASEQDDKNASAQIFALEQGGLGLPDRDYYFKTDAATKAIRSAYIAHIKKLFALTGADAAAAGAAAATIMTTETSLARASKTNVELRDPEANYHVVPIATLRATHDFDWPAFMTQLGVPRVPFAVVRQPAFVRGFDSLVARTSLADMKTYLRWHVIAQYGTFLPRAIDDEDFAFESTISGQKKPEPRWKRCVRQTDSALGEALGQVYVAMAFTPEAKAKALALVDNVQGVLRDDIGTLSWMGPATRARAVEKLAAYTKKIAYPDHWRTYAFAVTRSTAYDNVIAATAFEAKREIAKIGKPVDRTEWGLTPPTVNAYYNASNNEIVFPAGILQPPFYDPNADDAYNYGGIGLVIGHEMTHGFDDEGSLYDTQGNLKSWWTPHDKASFNKHAACIPAYFDTLTVVPGVKQNGKLVEGEAIADLGGATIAYKAYERSLTGKPRTLVDGYTDEQRFFLGFAQIWASNEREQYLRYLANIDPHPADKNRVNGTVANMAQFAAAWHCPQKAPLVRTLASRCTIW